MQMQDPQAGVQFQAHQVQNQVQGQVQGQGPQVGFRIITSPWQGDLDLSTKTGKALWDKGIKPVENKFSGMGKDLVRFLADVQNRVNKCQWQDIINIEGRSLVKRYGEITKEQVTGARDRRNNRAIATLQDARPIINAQMMYHFIYDSLGMIPQKKISTRLDDIQQDGPTLLKMVLDDTFVATQASTFTIKEKFYNLNLKKYKWNVQLLNQDICKKRLNLVAAGHASDETDTIISLFRAYETSTNEEFKMSVHFWKNEWYSGRWNTAEQLMEKADSKYTELKQLGT